MDKSEIELVFTRRFSMGHRLIAGNSSHCAVPHGHNEYVTVVLVDRSGKPQALDGKANMVTPFFLAKHRWHKFIDGRVDHTLQLGANDPLLKWFSENEPERLERIMVTPGDPTTELTAALLFAKLNAFLKVEQPQLTVKSVEIQETPTNTVKIVGDPYVFIPQDSGLDWWNRADDTVAG